MPAASRASSIFAIVLVTVPTNRDRPSFSARLRSFRSFFHTSGKRMSPIQSVPVQREREEKRYPLVSIPPFGRGFSRHPGLPIRCVLGRARKTNFRAREHRLDEPARLSLGMVASLQSPLPFHPAKTL